MPPSESDAAVTTTRSSAVVRFAARLGTTTRRTGAGVLAGSLAIVVVVSACAAPREGTAPSATLAGSTTSPTAQPAKSPTEPSLQEQADQLAAPELAATVDVTSVGATAAPQTALATAMLLAVKGRAPKTGYSRDQFGSGWVDVDRNGCDTRNDILARDLEPQTFKAGTHDCVVLTGTLADPYSATTISFIRGNETSNAVQIDHVVALSDAWQKGAQSWDGSRRTAFANDPMNLLAVDGPLNMQKGDGDAATWLPPNKAYRCQYVARQVGVKYTYGLWVTEAERNAMVSVLSTCPGEALPSGSAVPAAPAPAPAPAPQPAVADPAPAPAVAPNTSVYYANCTAARAAGAAPVHIGDPGYSTKLDRDGDGIGCE
ncbi:excalibur calcium-binding domain protein [mine drainage metagenome]|uniref:Excalibur calcium-binding domain protein n=1 Tax=mine drainage metagenome TaxID=410659 RepID=A0A1J5QKI1_9ZZZZ